MSSKEEHIVLLGRCICTNITGPKNATLSINVMLTE